MCNQINQIESCTARIGCAHVQTAVYNEFQSASLQDSLHANRTIRCRKLVNNKKRLLCRLNPIPLVNRLLCAGIANPAPIISTFLLEPSLAQKVRLDGICTVVDTKHVSMHLDKKPEEDEDEEIQEALDEQNLYQEAMYQDSLDRAADPHAWKHRDDCTPEELKKQVDQLSELDKRQIANGNHLPEEDGQGGEAAAQIAYADRIILNKTDLVTPEDLKALEVRTPCASSLKLLLYCTTV